MISVIFVPIVLMLAMCFTGLFIHGVLPPPMIPIVRVPIVKNKRVSICSKNNYCSSEYNVKTTRKNNLRTCLGGFRNML